MKFKINWDNTLRHFAAEAVEDLVLGAYRKLKSDSYYDQIDLWLRKNIAKFEGNEHITKLDNLTSLLKGMCIDDIPLDTLKAMPEIEE